MNNTADTPFAVRNYNGMAAVLPAKGLVDTLKRPWPFTVFARTDDAVAKIQNLESVLAHK